MAQNIWAKLNLKDHETVFVLSAPESFESEIERLQSVEVKRRLGRSKNIDLFLAFVKNQSEIRQLASKVGKFEGDAVVWFAYPKKSSKNFSCDFSRILVFG